MKDLRKTLQKHIYETFRVNRIPFFVGMKGTGKHYAIEAYAQQYNFKTVHLSNELPEHEDTIYICDDLNDIDYIQKLSSFLLKNNYKVCFISDNLPLIEMYELVTNKLELFMPWNSCSHIRIQKYTARNFLKMI